MKKLKLFFSFITLFSAGFAASFADEDTPLFSLELKSYDALINDIKTFATAVGEDASFLETQIQAMLGPETLKLVDKSRSWHAAVWMKSVEQPPIIAVVLPVVDSEAFEAAMQTSMIAMLGAQFLDTGEHIVLFGSSPDMPVAEGWSEKIQNYAETLVLEPTETFQIRLTLNDHIREMMVATMATFKAEMIAAIEDPSFEMSGIPPETMNELMVSYFSIYEMLLLDLDRLEYGMSVNDADLTFSLTLTPLEGSGSSQFLASQNVDISDLGASVSWDSDITMLMGMAAFPNEWQPSLQKLMEGLMPLYGLSDDTAKEWMDVMNETLPFKGAYNMNFNGGLSFFGFYDILETSAADVYEKWLAICESAVGKSNSTASYYSDINIQRDHRSHLDHSVDLVELVINPEHPIMQLPEQKAAMEQMFEGGKLAYEMSVVDDRIYMATVGQLDAAMAEINTAPPLEINSDTRIAGSVNIISLVKMGAEISDTEMEIDVSTLDSTGTQFLFKADTGESLSVQGVMPLKLLGVLSKLE